ncbi:right-handed parallel beta-helix repeat-containing protein [Bartonella schoenbuchensis]|uniref:right-handed parallel beta-helix repeat-containing protein n=1 Tax=Bartonella schoenbuchensis TaxID=165694 RepID=UPI0031CC40FC
MVMRRVFNHHVCLCVLSTAILAGLALMTSQNKVYAQAQNCKGLAGDKDSAFDPIVCDGTTDGRGWGNDGRPATNGEWGELSGKRDIDMNKYSGKAAVTVYNGSGTAKIRIVAPLTVRDSGGTSNNTTAIKVHSGGILVVVDADVAGVQKGIVVDGLKSSVMVVEGKIGVKNGGGGSLIEVSNNGEVVLNKWVTVGTVSGNNAGEVVINNGGTVQLNGQSFNNVTTGIKIKGTKGTANVRGGATINLASSGTGLEMDMSGGTANVMELEIKGNGGKERGMLINGRGTVVMTKVKLMQLEMGARVTSGTLKILGESTINVAENGTGLNVSGGKVVMMGGSITVGRDGTGMSVSGGKATMVMGSITGNGSGSKGVEVKGRANVTLTSVTMKDVDTGVEVDGGTLKLEGKTTIKVGGSGSGIYAKSGTLMMSGMTTINVTGVGTGMYVTGGTVMMTGGSLTIKGSGSGKGVYVKGSADVTLERVDISEVATGVYMEGGTLTVEGGTIRGNGSGGTGVFVTGGNLTMEGVDISNVETGVQMEGTGTLMVEGGTIGFVGSGKGVYVGSSVTEATLTNVTIMGKGKGDGIYVKGGTATVTLERVNISQVETGIYAGGGTLKVEGGTIVGNGSGKGVYVTGGKANVTLEGVNISNVERGIYMEGESLTVSGGKIGFKGEHGYGIYVGKKVQSTSLIGVTIEGSGKGDGVLMTGSTGTLTMTGVNISKVERGIYMEAGESLMVSGGKIGFAGTYGVMVGSSVTSAELTGVEIKGRGGKGVGVYAMGEKVTVSGVNVSQVETGIYMEAGESLTVSGGKIGFKGTYGVYVGGGVRAELTKVTIEGSGKGYGIYAKSGDLTVSGGTIRGGERGIWVTGGSLTVKEGTTITGVKVGIKMMGGTLTVEKGTRIEFKGSGSYDYGIGVGKGVTSASLTGVKIEGNGKGSGVLMMGSTGTLMMDGVNISKVETGVYAMGGVLMVSGGTRITGVEAGIKMMGYGVLKVKDGTRIEFTGEYGYGVYVEGGVKSTTLAGVEIKGNGKGDGIYAKSGDLTVIGGEIKEVERGIAMTGGGTLIMKEGTRIQFKGSDGYGVYVGSSVTSASLTGVTIEGRGVGRGFGWRGERW